MRVFVFKSKEMNRKDFLPDGKVNFLIDFVPPEKIAEGEPFELDGQNIRKAPQRHLLRCFSVLFTPGKKRTDSISIQMSYTQGLSN